MAGNANAATIEVQNVRFVASNCSIRISRMTYRLEFTGHGPRNARVVVPWNAMLGDDFVKAINRLIDKFRRQAGDSLPDPNDR